jgi:hypothetical protein
MNRKLDILKMPSAKKLKGSLHFPAEAETVRSFLINALYLIGNHHILVQGALDAWVKDELIKFGHRVDQDELQNPRLNHGKRFDRIVRLSQILGSDTEEDTVQWLRSMRKRLLPGGLLCFHVMDRDRAWDRVKSEGQVNFNPATGIISGRLRKVPGAKPIETSSENLNFSIRTYNLLEVEGLLKATGFKLERAYGDWKGGSHALAGEKTGRLIIVATKQRERRR